MSISINSFIHLSIDSLMYSLIFHSFYCFKNASHLPAVRHQRRWCSRRGGEDRRPPHNDRNVPGKPRARHTPLRPGAGAKGKTTDKLAERDSIDRTEQNRRGGWGSTIFSVLPGKGSNNNERRTRTRNSNTNRAYSTNLVGR